MKMLNVLLVGLAMLAGTTVVSAQETAKKTPQQRADQHTERMTKTLGLTDEQRAKVAELNLGVAQKNEVVRNDANMTKEQKQAALKGNHQGRKDQLKNILTAEQFQKFEEHEAQVIAKRKAKKEEKKKKQIAPLELEEL
jgi:Spy/CpxP family protein refolding chaperone